MQVLLTRMRSGNYNPDDKEISSRRKAVGVSSERRRSAPFEDDEEDAYFSLSLPFPFSLLTLRGGRLPLRQKMKASV